MTNTTTTTSTVESIATRIRAACDAISDEMTWDTPAHLIRQLVEKESDDFDTGVALLAKSFLDNYENTCNGAFGSVRLTSNDDIEHVTGEGLYLTPSCLLGLHEGTNSTDYYSMLIEDKRAAEQAA